MNPGDNELAEALSAEHAAIFGYSVIGAHASAAVIGQVRAADLAHRNRRDRLMSVLADKGVQIPGAEPIYALPFPVTSDSTGLKLAVLIEDRTATFWQRALPDTTGDDRRFALTALVDCATRATAWRRLSGVSPAVVPFPGQI